MQLHHLAVQVRDLDVAEAFYVGRLGLAVRLRHDDAEGRPRSIWLDLDEGAFLALERCEAPRSSTRDSEAGWHCVALGIAATERAAWLERLAAASIPIERTSAYTLYVRDPDGTLLGLSHYPEPAPT